jgi:hypothetical protein
MFFSMQAAAPQTSAANEPSANQNGKVERISGTPATSGHALPLLLRLPLIPLLELRPITCSPPQESSLAFINQPNPVSSLNAVPAPTSPILKRLDPLQPPTPQWCATR